MKSNNVTSLLRRIIALCLCVLICPVPQVFASDAVTTIELTNTVIDVESGVYEYDVPVAVRYTDNVDTFIYDIPEVTRVFAESGAVEFTTTGADAVPGTITLDVQGTEYTLNLELAGSNMYTNGSLEDGLWPTAWCAFELITSNPGNGNNSILAKGNGYYSPEFNPETLEGGKTYLAQSMIRKWEGYTNSLSASETVKAPAASGTVSNIDIIVNKWNADGTERSGSFALNETEWFTHYRTITPAASGQVVDYYMNHTSWRPGNFVVDEYFLGDLVVSDIELTDGNGDAMDSIDIPYDTSVETELSAVIYNQLGNQAAMLTETVSSWYLAEDYTGISLTEDGILTVDDTAESGEITVVAEIIPSWDDAIQTNALFHKTITLNPPVDRSVAYLESVSVNDTEIEGFEENKMQYTVAIPYSHNMENPSVNAVPLYDEAEVRVDYSDDKIEITVTNGDIEVVYTITVELVGGNMYVNGDFEQNSSATDGSYISDLIGWSNNPNFYRAEKDSPGQGEISIVHSANVYNRYVHPREPLVLKTDKTYLFSSMVRRDLEHDYGEGTVSVRNNVDRLYDTNYTGSGVRGISANNWNEDGSSRTNVYEVTNNWTTMYATICGLEALPEDERENEEYIVYNMVGNDNNIPFAHDAYFMGELLISGMTIIDDYDMELTEAEIPFEGKSVINLRGVALNQLGNRAGVGNVLATSWQLLSDYQGVTLTDDGVLTLDRTAEAGDIEISAVLTPTWNNPAQSGVTVTKTISLTPAVDRSGAQLEDIIVAGLSISDFHPKKYSYTAYVPYTYKPNDFAVANVPVPEVRAIAKNPESIVDISVPSSVNGEDIVITVTSPDGLTSATYTLTMKVVGYNMYRDGGFEQEGTWAAADSDRMIRIQDNPAAGEWAMYVDNRKGANYYAPIVGRPTLSAGYTYITQSMIRGIPDQNSHNTTNNFNGITTDPSAQTAYYIGKYNENGGSQGSFETKLEWQRAFAVIRPINNYAISNHFTVWGKEDPFVIDEYFVGELIVSAMTYKGENTGVIPAAGAEPTVVKLGASMVNQFGNSIGLDSKLIKYELVEDQPGITIEGDRLYVSENAKSGSFRLRAYYTPEYGSTQGKAAITTVITLTPASNVSYLPQAKNVTLSGRLDLGSVLTADYLYYQINNDPRGTCVHKWYAEDLDGSGRVEITSNEGNMDFVVTSEYLNKKIYFEVTPVSYDGTIGAKVISNYICTPLKPYATDVKISGERYIGSKLSASYVYNDVNSDEEDKDAVSYAWYISDNSESGFELIPGETSSEYTVRYQDVGRYIRARVTPASTDAPYEGVYGESESILAAGTPTISNLRIEENGSGTYTVFYDYNHPTGITEDPPAITWNVNGGSTSVNNKSVTVAAGTSGTLSVTVTVNASKEPVIGETATTSITIKGASSPIRVPSGGGGGGGGGSIGGSSAFVPLPEKKTEEVKKEEPAVVRHWAADGIDFCKAQGIMQDPVPGDFKNAQIVTRAELVSYIIKTLGAKETAYTHIFADVSGADYFSGALQTAVNLGIISEAENFEPNRNVTRQEVAKILVTAFGNEISADTDLTKFADNDTISEWAKDYVSKAVTKGIFKGVSETQFDPLGSITREQTAVVLKRLYDLRNGGTAQ